MSTPTTSRKQKTTQTIVYAWLAAICSTAWLNTSAQAQFAPVIGQGSDGQAYTTLRNPLIPGANYAPPYAAPAEGPAVAPGDGTQSKAVSAGDSGNPLPPSSSTADSTAGTRFPTGIGYDRTTIFIQRQGSSGRGSRIVQTLRADQLTAQQKSQIAGLLGVNLDSGEAQVHINASDSQLAQLQSILNPYPGGSTFSGRTKIASDSPAANYGINKPSNQSIYNFAGQLPTVKTFARYLVLLGVVSATIWMAIAAFGVVLGNPYAGARVISAAAGLMLLLCAYTIWKIVQMNTFKANSVTPALLQNRPGQAQVSNAYLNPNNSPAVPNGGRPVPARFGIPLVPLGASQNNQ